MAHKLYIFAVPFLKVSNIYLSKLFLFLVDGKTISEWSHINRCQYTRNLIDSTWRFNAAFIRVLQPPDLIRHEVSSIYLTKMFSDYVRIYLPRMLLFTMSHCLLSVKDSYLKKKDFKQALIAGTRSHFST